jgi:hypothetical protein
MSYSNSHAVHRGHRSMGGAMSEPTRLSSSQGAWQQKLVPVRPAGPKMARATQSSQCIILHEQVLVLGAPQLLYSNYSNLVTPFKFCKPGSASAS